MTLSMDMAVIGKYEISIRINIVVTMENGSLPELCIFSHLFALHYICISFAFRIAPGIDIFAIHFINISKYQIIVK